MPSLSRKHLERRARMSLRKQPLTNEIYIGLGILYHDYSMENITEQKHRGQKNTNSVFASFVSYLTKKTVPKHLKVWSTQSK